MLLGTNLADMFGLPVHVMHLAEDVAFATQNTHLIEYKCDFCSAEVWE